MRPNANIAHSPAEIKPSEFVRVLYGDRPPAGHLVLFYNKESQWHDLADLKHLDHNAALLSQLHDVYLSVCAQTQSQALEEKQKELWAKAAKTGKAPGKPNLKYMRGYSRTVGVVPGVWFEVDYREGEAHKEASLPTKAEAVSFIDLLPLKPTLVIASGHGLHLYWCFLRPFAVASEEDRSACQRLVRRWQEMVQSMGAARGWAFDSTHDLTRVLRPPGTLNRKSDPPKPVTVVKYHEEARYSFPELEACLPAEVLNSATISTSGTWSMEDVRAMLAAINDRPGYDDWFRITAAVLDACGGDIDLADMLLKEWRQEEVEGEYREKLESGLNGSITTGTLVMYARRYGYEPASQSIAARIGQRTAPGGDGMEKEEKLFSIEVNDRHGDEVVDDAIEALRAYNEPATLFRRGISLSYVTEDEKGRPVIAKVSEALLDDRLSRAANFLKVYHKADGKEYKPADIPSRYVKRIRDIPDLPFPPLDSIIEAPLVRPDGTILLEPGYDTATSLYLCGGLDIPDIPDDPSQAMAATALDVLREPIQDFPFVDEASRTNALAMMITPFVRAYLGEGNVPLAGVDAPTQGSGKTLLADVVALISTGRKAVTMSSPESEDEWRKQITAQLLKGLTLIVIDNVKGNLSSSALERCLTTSTWGDRVLGTSDQPALPQRATWIATGNNLSPYGDMIRRTYPIRIDAKILRPWQERDKRYAVPNLPEWVQENRANLIWAVLVMARAWISAGKPRPSVKPLGSFEGWTTTVGGILEYAGASNFLANLKDMYDEADDEGAEWAELLAAIYDVYGEDGKFLTKDLAEILEKEVGRESVLSNPKHRRILEAMPDPVQDALARNRSVSRTLGKMFKYRKDRRFGVEQWSISHALDRSAHVQKWWVTRGCATGDGHPNPADVIPDFQGSYEDSSGDTGFDSRPNVYKKNGDSHDKRMYRDMPKSNPTNPDDESLTLKNGGRNHENGRFASPGLEPEPFFPF